MSEFRFREKDSSSTKSTTESESSPFLQQLQSIDQDNKRTAGMIAIGGCVRGVFDTGILRHNQDILANANIDLMEVRKSLRLLPQTRDYLNVAATELEAANALQKATTAAERSSLTMKQVGWIPNDVMQELRRSTDHMRVSGTRPEWLNHEVAQLKFVEKLQATPSQDLRSMLTRETGTLKEVVAGEKLFVQSAPRQAQLSTYIEGRLTHEAARSKVAEALSAFKQAEQKTITAAVTANTHLQHPSTQHAPLRGLGRGLGEMALFATAVTAADILYQRMNGESISASTYKPSALMKVNELDALGIGALTTNTMPLKYRIAGHAAVFVAGRSWNIISER